MKQHFCNHGHTNKDELQRETLLGGSVRFTREKTRMQIHSLSMNVRASSHQGTVIAM